MRIARRRRCYRRPMRIAGAIALASLCLAGLAEPAGAALPSGPSHCSAREVRGTLASYARALNRGDLGRPRPDLRREARLPVVHDRRPHRPGLEAPRHPDRLLPPPPRPRRTTRPRPLPVHRQLAPLRQFRNDDAPLDPGRQGRSLGTRARQGRRRLRGRHGEADRDQLRHDPRPLEPAHSIPSQILIFSQSRSARSLSAGEVAITITSRTVKTARKRTIGPIVEAGV